MLAVAMFGGAVVAGVFGIAAVFLFGAGLEFVVVAGKRGRVAVRLEVAAVVGSIFAEGGFGIGAAIEFRLGRTKGGSGAAAL